MPFEQRVEDLIQRLTLEEKISQLLYISPSIPRLDIPAYTWWNEGLHGVVRTPYDVTVFPQCIGMAATWDTSAVDMMGDLIATEARAIFNLAERDGLAMERYRGLTYWAPNINIFRDPRWGRGQETFGEDPYLTSRMGKAFVMGMQGDDSVYLKVAACAKHYAVHSGPEVSRHRDNIDPSPHDLWDTYLPAFRTLVTEANVAGVMCAYNAVNSQPCCANDQLLKDILRDQWKFKGYVVTDCWALSDFVLFHKTHQSITMASADAINHLVDLDCGYNDYKKLITAVRNGLVREKQIDESLKRVLMIRFRLGLFDPVSKVRYAQAGASELGSAEHIERSLELARKSMVLLKNERDLLPLKKDSIRKIAVIGPNADNEISVLGNYTGRPEETISVLEGIQNKLGRNTEVIYEKGISFTDRKVLVPYDILHMIKASGMEGFRIEYFSDTSLKKSAAPAGFADAIDLKWKEGKGPLPGQRSNDLSVRCVANLIPDSTMDLYFEASADDGYRVYVDSKLVAESWTGDQKGKKRLFKVNLVKGVVTKLVMEAFQLKGKGTVLLKPGLMVETDLRALADKASAADVIIFAGGISPELEGEEMAPVGVPGFDVGDRTSIMIPAVQTELLKLLVATGKPVVFVMMTGSALAIPWEAEHVPAILNAWYGGQQAGNAVADILFGDYNPSGRLPVTFYGSDKDLPDFRDYDMKGRTYRYFKGKPLYPFGFGLSYSRFNYQDLNVQLKPGDELTIEAQVTNTGSRSGDEVVQLYLSYPDEPGAPVRALKSFRRVSLQSGENQRLRFLLAKEDLTLIAADGRSYRPSGRLVVSLGGLQPGFAGVATSNFLEKEIVVH